MRRFLLPISSDSCDALRERLGVGGFSLGDALLLLLLLLLLLERCETFERLVDPERLRLRLPDFDFDFALPRDWLELLREPLPDDERLALRL